MAARAHAQKTLEVSGAPKLAPPSRPSRPRSRRRVARTTTTSGIDASVAPHHGALHALARARARAAAAGRRARGTPARTPRPPTGSRAGRNGCRSRSPVSGISTAASSSGGSSSPASLTAITARRPAAVSKNAGRYSLSPSSSRLYAFPIASQAEPSGERHDHRPRRHAAQRRARGGDPRRRRGGAPSPRPGSSRGRRASPPRPPRRGPPRAASR